MDKKIIISVLLLYLFCTLASPIVMAEEKSEQIQIMSISTPEISFEFTENLTGEPINPLQTQEVNMKVKFKLEMSSIAKWFFFKRRIGRLLLFGPSYIFKFKALPKSNLSINISGSPTWCSANIDTDTLDISFADIGANKNSTVEKTFKLEFTVNENAAALDNGEIKIQADFLGLGGIKATTNSITIPVIVAYVPDIIVETESELTIAPLKNTTVPINLTNNANGDSIISILYITPENWTATFDQESLTLKVNETKQIILIVNPPKEFSNQTINISFIPKSTAGLYEGAPIISSINFINDGSLKEEAGQDVMIVGIIIIIIIILMVFTFLLLRKKKQ
jgi:hypothetical protein